MLLLCCLVHISCVVLYINTLRSRQNGRHFADDIFKRVFLNDNIWIQIKISLQFVPKGSINNIPALVKIMAWRRPGAKPLSEPMMVSLLTHICVTRPQWVNKIRALHLDNEEIIQCPKINKQFFYQITDDLNIKLTSVQNIVVILQINGLI